jgi:hypothetical protein
LHAISKSGLSERSPEQNFSYKNKKPTSLAAVGQVQDQIELCDQLNEPALTMPEDICAPR